MTTQIQEGLFASLQVKQNSSAHCSSILDVAPPVQARAFPSPPFLEAAKPAQSSSSIFVSSGAAPESNQLGGTISDVLAKIEK